jgi:SAM-dependent methyltransferase
MYSESITHDVLLFCKAVCSNQLARFAPGLYVRLTGETGRGDEAGDDAAVADYFLRCFDDYFDALGIERDARGDFLAGKAVLEYGPGDVLGVALLLYAHGAARVQCVDRFPLSRVTPRNLSIYRLLLERLAPAARARADRAFAVHGDPASGFDPAAIAYKVTPDGLAGQPRAYDLVISRAVLEHVNDLPRTVADIAASLAPGGISVHEVDLRSHGLDRYRVYDFLTWPDALYRVMYGRKGFPNRWRVDKYRELFSRSGLRVRALRPTGTLSQDEIAPIVRKLPARLRGVSPQELAWLGFWAVLEPGGAGMAT